MTIENSSGYLLRRGILQVSYAANNAHAQGFAWILSEHNNHNNNNVAGHAS